MNKNKNKNDKSKQQNDAMLKVKTNQDFNNQKPDPEDPNQNKKHQENGDEENEADKTVQPTENNRYSGRLKQEVNAKQEDYISGYDWGNTFPFNSLRSTFSDNLIS